MIRVQKKAFDPGAEINEFACSNSNSGAVATFIGQVRDFQSLTSDASHTITSLELEHYPGMTEKELTRIGDEAKSRWLLDDLLVIHRFGKMSPGEGIVLVCTASAHRGDAFDACAFVMDWLKTQAPFWKREETEGGASWVEAKDADTDRASRWTEES